MEIVHVTVAAIVLAATIVNAEGASALLNLNKLEAYGLSYAVATCLLGAVAGARYLIKLSRPDKTRRG